MGKYITDYRDRISISEIEQTIIMDIENSEHKQKSDIRLCPEEKEEFLKWIEREMERVNI